MILYHGSNIEIDNINLTKCRPYKDFGRGFYLTSIKEQAELWAKRINRIYSGESWITEFEFQKTVLTTGALRVKIFYEANLEWAEFVLNNRNRNYVNYSDANSNHDNKYEIVIGPVANDDIALQLRQFISGLVNSDSLINALKYRNLNDQYSFHSENAVKYLIKKGAWRNG